MTSKAHILHLSNLTSFMVYFYGEHFRAVNGILLIQNKVIRTLIRSSLVTISILNNFYKTKSIKFKINSIYCYIITKIFGNVTSYITIPANS